MKKVTVIGAGNVGATTVYYLADKNVADIVMIDVVEGLPQSKAMDYLHAGPLRKFNIDIVGSNDYSEIRDSDVVVMTAGIPRKPGMDRMDLLKTNVGIAKTAGEAIAKYAPLSRRVGMPIGTATKAATTPESSTDGKNSAPYLVIQMAVVYDPIPK